MTEPSEEPRLPEWVPDVAGRYLMQTEAGRPIREIARDLGCHASTVLRQIRRVETRRDDPLVDEALRRIGDRHFGQAPDADDETEARARLDDNLLRVLRRMAESGAVLAIAAEMEKGVVVRDGPGEAPARTAVVDRALAQVMALNEWIDCQTQGRVSRYVITPAGRAELGRLVARGENRARAAHSDGPPPDRGAAPARRPHFAPGDSPLAALARRKDRDGRVFLSDDLVSAGERLREDFELAQMNAGPDAGWRRFLRPGGPSTDVAEARIIAALGALGPGLADVALRCCCLLEGLEIAERRMGWSARSGKIVLRIALTQLRRHYAGLGEADRMIG